MIVPKQQQTKGHQSHPPPAQKNNFVVPKPMEEAKERKSVEGFTNSPSSPIEDNITAESP